MCFYQFDMKYELVFEILFEFDFTVDVDGGEGIFCWLEVHIWFAEGR